MGTYLCFEVMMPGEHRTGAGNERVDLLSCDTKGLWRFYELKVTKADFHSKCKHTFLGHYNYFVMPFELFEQVKHEIPIEVGCYVSDDNRCWCIKKARNMPLRIDENKLKFSFTQALSRQHEKYMRLLKNMGGA